MPFWESGRMTQTEAYAWLAKQLGIENVERSHFGWFDVATCERAYDICTAEQVIA